MPCFVLNTNLPKEKIPPDFVKSTAELVAKTLGKPLSYIVVHINPDQLMGWGGGSDPCALASLMSIGKLGVQENKKHAAALYKHIEKHLGIPGDRMYISFFDADKSNVGYTGTTFHDIL
uniref:L-dopachrome isomerase n=1 Tax=Hadrurus spadix TaxID=141984 RepID=A0A1W7RA73_9SCOR